MSDRSFPKEKLSRKDAKRLRSQQRKQARKLLDEAYQEFVNNLKTTPEEPTAPHNHNNSNNNINNYDTVDPPTSPRQPFNVDSRIPTPPNSSRHVLSEGNSFTERTSDHPECSTSSFEDERARPPPLRFCYASVIMRVWSH